MNTQAPSTARILTMVAFAASCIGLLLFLWISFGGATSLGPKGYEISAEFNQAENLGSQADVRISGVGVGKVLSVSLDRHTGLTKAVMEIDPQFAPRPIDTRAILRQKTLLGETYIELSPGSHNGPKLADGATLPHGQVAPTVQLDQILSTFDPTTRRAFQTWMQQQGTALTGRGQDLNAALAELYPFATNVDSVLSVLNRDSAATRTLLRDGGQVFSSIAHSPAALQQLVENSNAAFSATAAQAGALAATIRAFPAFLVSQRVTINRVKQFAVTTKPLVDELRPAAVQLSPALKATAVLAPQLKRLLVGIGPLTNASKAGIPALERFLDTSVPLLTRATPYLGGVVPVLDYINTYRREIAGFFANGTASSGAVAPAVVSNEAAALRAGVQPGQSGDADRLLEPDLDQSRQPVSGSGRRLEPGLRPARVRQLSVHEQPSAGDRPYYSGLAGCGFELRLLHVGPEWAAVPGTATARRSNYWATSSVSPTTTSPMSMAGSAENNQKEESVATNRRNRHGACRARRRGVGLRRHQRPQHLQRQDEVLAEQGGQRQRAGGPRLHPALQGQRHGRQPHRAADRHQDEDLRPLVNQKNFPTCSQTKIAAAQERHRCARRAR